jgi:N-acetylmuramoyl-L-alanine amidase
MLDTGHGGNDPGAIRTVNGVDYSERAFNDQLMNACYQRLIQYDNVIVYRTRVANNHISTYARADYAARVGAGLFLSFHINSSSYKSAHGACTIIPCGNYRPEMKTAAANLTEKILSGLTEVGLKNNGFLTRALEDAAYLDYPDGSAGDYYEVIRMGVRNGIPSMILETAFITSDTDLAILTDAAKIERIGAIVADAIARQYGLKITGKTLTQPVQTAQSSGVSLGSVPGTLNLGDIYPLTASGGSGEGEYAFLATNPYIARVEGNNLIITGSGQFRVTVTRLEGETTTPRSAGNTNVTARAFETSLTGELVSVRNSGEGGGLIASVSVALKDRVDSVIPQGKVTARADNGAEVSSRFGDDWSLILELPFASGGEYDCALTYEPVNYDGYSIGAGSLKLAFEGAPEPTETPTPEPTAVPTEEAVPTEGPTPSEEATASATQGPVPTDPGDGSSVTFGLTEILMCLLVAAVVVVIVLLIKLISRKKRS